MAARRRSVVAGGGFAAAIVLLVVIGLTVEFFWWIAGGAVLIGLLFAGREILHRAQERLELAEGSEAALRRRAERQHRWIITGDSRGVYGADGASAMRAVSPAPMAPDGEEAGAQQIPEFATLAATADELTALMIEKPREWRWAVFASVLVQRTAPLLPRLRDSELGFTPPTATQLRSGRELAGFLFPLLDEMALLVQQVESFMLAPAFMGAFGDPADESSADAEAIKHLADRLMDYQYRFLALSERCRSVSAPSQYADLLADCARLTDIPLQGYREFTAEFVELVESAPRVLEHASGVIPMGSIKLHMEVDGPLIKRIFKRLHAIGPVK